MSLLLLGISHHTAGLELREPLALPEVKLAPALRLLAEQPGVVEGMILSTCNRVEVLIAGAGEAPDLFRFLAVASGQPSLPPADHFYQLRDSEAVRHLFRVASSLDSLVVGEPQILGQLKQAYAAAQTAGLVGGELEAALSRAFRAAKRVRTETAIAEQPVSVSQTAVDLARQIFGSLENKTVLLLGAGTMGAAAARYLMQQGAQRLLVLNRTLSHAQVLAEKHGGTAHPLQQLGELGEQADVVIACTGAPRPLVSRADAARFLGKRRGRPMLFLDLAVPRDVEPSVHQLDNAFVYNVDDLDQVVSANLEGRRQEAARGEEIIAAEVAAYEQRRDGRAAIPTLVALQAQAESLRAAEWERVRKRLGPLTREQEQAIEGLTRSLMQKWLHSPLVEIREAMQNPGTESARRLLTEMVHRLFDLPAAGGHGEEKEADALIAAARRRPEPSGRPLPGSEATALSDRRERPKSGVEYPPRSAHE
ncbi:MAG TPA: glutamyl-tRNA reductase [Terriglobales bacterium]|jgi:glutamyl-tRNA reductase